eukprot:720043-Prymnesium_polylepis.2
MNTLPAAAYMNIMPQASGLPGLTRKGARCDLHPGPASARTKSQKIMLKIHVHLLSSPVSAQVQSSGICLSGGTQKFHVQTN